MGASRRLFVRSDEEDEGGGDVQGDGAGPSTSSAARKSRKLSARQAACESHHTVGKDRKYKRLKCLVQKEAKDSDSDWMEESSDCEEIPKTAWREKWSQKREDKVVRGESSKRSSKGSPLPSVSARKRKPRLSSAQNTSNSKAKSSLYDYRFNESTQKQTGSGAHILLGEEFEELLFEEALNASKETYTKEIDLPERFQMHEEILTATESRDDWTKEAHWIYDRLFKDSAMIAQDEDLKCIADIDKEIIMKEIVFVLMQLHFEKCEVPVIGMYKFQGCTHLAKRMEMNNTGFEFGGNSLRVKSLKVLWMVYQCDRKWLSLLNRKILQQETWKSRAVISKEIGPAAEDRTLNVLVQALEDADSEVAVDDLEAKFNLQFPIDEKAPPKGQYKRPKRQSFYSLCCKSGLRSLVTELGLTPEQLGENLYALQKIHEPFDCSVGPGDFDLRCASGQFTDLQSALTGARHVAAYELACEPRVRNFVRSLFHEHAVVSTKPTSKGKAFIDAFHEFACVKNVQAKSVTSFNDAEWLLIQKAEKDELLEVFIDLTQEVFDGIVMQSLQEKYFSSASSEVAELWNEQRKLTLREALSQMLLPLLAKETRLSLTTRAKDWVQAECCKSLWKRVSMAPYPNRDPFADASTSSKASTDTENAAVLACCWGSRNPPTTFVMLDAFGEMVDTLQTGYLNVHPGSHEQQLQRKLDDQERLKKFILVHKPNVVVVGAVVNVACRHLKDTIAETVGKAAEVNSALTSVPVIYGDESLASLYEKSQVSLMQLPKQPSIIRRAVALGRNLQDPLALIAALCNPSKDIVALSMHPMQRFLSAEEIYNSIECVMISVTNQVGVDVNLAVAHEWFFSPLQFVCGLGWKKASKLQQLIQDSGWLQSRESLFSYPFSLKDVVFKNCSGFLRIRRVGHAISGLRKLDPLDDTRIHPDYYELAQNLAIYAFTNGQTLLDGENDTDMVEAAIMHFQKNPDALTEETVSSFFNSLQDTELVNIETLKDIRAELLCGFSDYRVPYSQPTQDEEFSWLTGEDDTSLCTGKAVNAIVHKVFRHRVICILESGIRGVLEKEDFTSDPKVDLTQVFSEGSSLTCCIASVLKDQFSVQLTCLGNDTEAHDCNASESPARRVPFSEEAAEKPGPSNLKEYSFKPRDIHHPLFQNVSISDAIKALSDQNPGKVIFHPSSEGPACLSMTLKCQDNVCLRKEIEEFEKDSTDLATFSQLGKVLKVDGRSFCTLDEVVTSYASPLISKMNEVLQSGQFQSRNDGEIRSFLNQEKQACTDSLVYCFSLCPNNPGAIAMSYMVDDKVLRERVDLYPEGFGLQNKMFRKIDTVVNYIKKAVNDASSRWVGRDEERDKQRGDGTGRGHGGRFGSGRRGRGYQGRGGRGNNSSGKWGAQEKESSDWNFAGSNMNEQKKQEEEGVSNWAAEESNGWNDQKSSFEVSKSQDKSGWGVTDGVTENPQSGWGVDDSMNTEISGWGAAGSGDGTGRGHGGRFGAGQRSRGYQGRGGRGNSPSKKWGAQEKESSDWTFAGSNMNEQKKHQEEGIGNSAAEESNGWNHQKASFEVSKSQDKSGWGVTDGVTENPQSGWGADDSMKTEISGWGAAGSDDGTGRGRGGRFESGRRGRGYQGRGGRGYSSSGKWGAQEKESSDWTFAGLNMNEKKHKEEGVNNWAAEESNGWNDQKSSFEVSKSQDKNGWGVTDGVTENPQSGWGADDSMNTEISDWGAAGSDMKEKQSKNEKQDSTGWHVGEEKSGNGNGAGFEANKRQNESGWGDTNVQLGIGESGFGWGADDSRNIEQSGCEAVASDTRDEQSKNEKPDPIGWQVGEKSVTEGNSRNGNAARFEASKGQNDSAWSDGNVQGQSGWGVEDSQQDLPSWHVGKEYGECEGNRRSQNGPGFEASKGPNDSGWGDANVELDKGQTGSGWGAKSSTEEPDIGWNESNCETGKETTKSQACNDWASGDGLLGKGPTTCVSAGGDVNGQTGWGDENLQEKEIGSRNESRSKAFSSGNNQSDPGWGTPEDQIDSGWGGDVNSSKNSMTASAQVSKTPEPCAVQEGLTNESGWEASKIQVDDGWGALDSSPGKSQAGDGWGNSDVTSQKKDIGGGWGNNGASTSKVLDASGWGSSDAWKYEGTNEGSGTRTTGQWGASEEENKSGWKCSNDKRSEDNNQYGRGSFRGGQGWGRGRGRGCSSRWTQKEDDGGQVWGRGRGRGGSSGWAQKDDDGGQVWGKGRGRDGSSGWAQKDDDGGQVWGRGRGRGGSSSWAQKDDDGGQGWSRGRGRGGSSGWTQKEDEGGQGWGIGKGRGGSSSWTPKEDDDGQGWGRGRGRGGYNGWTQKGDAASDVERGFKRDWSQSEDGGSGRASRGRGRGRGRGRCQEEGDTWGGWSSQGEGGNRRGGRGHWSQAEGAGRGGWPRGEDGNDGGGSRGSWDGAGRRGRGGRGCWSEGSQRQGEDASDNTWGSKPLTGDGWSGWTSSTDAGNVNSNSSGWDVHEDAHDDAKKRTATAAIEEECNVPSKSSLETIEDAEPNILSELEHEEANKESIEATGDGIWGACEDLIDSNEMEGLISQKGPSTSAPEPQHAHVAVESEETMESVLRGLENDDKSDSLAASMLDYACSDKGIIDAAIDDRSTLAVSTEPGKEMLEDM